MFKYEVRNQLIAIDELDTSIFSEMIDKMTLKNNKIILFHHGKKYKYFCTNCKTWHDCHHVKLKTKLKCENCNKTFEVICKRNVIRTCADFITYLQTDKENNMIIRSFFFKKKFNKEKMDFDINCFEIGRYNYDVDVGIVRYSYTSHYVVYFENEQYLEKWKKPSDSYEGVIEYINVYKKDINKIIRKRSDLKYSQLKKAIKYFDIVDYMNLYKRYNELELLFKFNCTNYIKSIAKSHIYNENFLLLLETNKKYIRYIVKYNLSAKEFEKMFELEIFDVEKVRMAAKYNVCKKDFVDSKININKLIMYLHQQKQQCNMYNDYLGLCNYLGVDMKKTKNMFPNNLKQAHDELSISKSNIDNKKYEKGFIENYMKNIKYMYCDKKYIVYPVENPHELIIESINNKNCVKSYIPKVDRGDCEIFLMREINKIDKSLVTIEIIDNELNQVKAFDNGKINQSEKKFIIHWCKKKNLEYRECADVKYD
ncbi:MAG: PcfJ domain-containing protein [Candidatus Izemoplasmatales bacterium]|nr:PcfJ domain-containing protein [Candidatus Izemoplasmatales bacterium]